MDHKVSKDMISSGMIPSGEKTQADLGRTQYGSAPSPSKLMDAYKSMYEHHQKDKDGNTIPHEGEELNEVSKKTLGNYIKKASTDLATRSIKHGMSGGTETGGDPDSPKNVEKINKRHSGIMKAADKLKKEEVEVNEEPVSATLLALGKLGAMAGKVGAAAAKTGVKIGAKVGGKTGANVMKSVARNPMGAIDNINRVGYAAQTVGNMMPKPSVPAVTKKQSQGGMISADVDVFDIVKGQLLDEGLSEEEIKDIMLTLTPDEILKEIEESSLSAGSSGGHYSDGGDGVFRSKEQVGRQFNKNFPPAKNGKVDKVTRKAINTSARDFGIQGPTTLKQSVEPEGETI